MASDSPRLILYHVSEVHAISAQQRGLEWLFLGRDYRGKREWERNLGAERRLNYKRHLTKVSYELRNEYIGWISELGRPFWNQWEWWISRLATRSNAISPLYLYVCYLEILRSVLTNRGEDLVVVSESWELLESIENTFSDVVVCVKPNPVRKSVYGKVHVTKHACMFCLSWSKFILLTSLELVLARLSRSGRVNETPFRNNHAVIHTCIDDFAAETAAEFKDRYYPGLKEYLESAGIAVSTLIWLCNVKLARKYALFKWFRARSESFLIPHDYMSIFDLLKVFETIVKSGNFALNSAVKFRGLDISPLVQNEQRLQRRNTGGAYFVLQKFMIRRWREIGYSLALYFDTWELKHCEVPAIHAIRENFPSCRVASYQHGALVPKLLFANYKTTSEEFSHAIHGDFLIANSGATKRYLTSEGFPETSITVGPALRYAYLQGKTHGRPKSANKVVLVCLPMMTSTAEEIMETVHAASLASIEGLTMYVKFHPMMNTEELLRRLSFRWPSSYHIASGTMGEWLAKSDCVVVAESATMVESVYFTIPTIVLRKETDIDILPLDMISDLEDERTCEFVVGPSELRESVVRIMRGRPHDTHTNVCDFFEFSFDSLSEKLVLVLKSNLVL
jgi:surface carbohydrate biosynthesis protein (TIGR04326 family)